MTILLHFSHDDICKEIPYQIIAETTSRSVWNTGRRKRLWNELFTEQERRTCSDIRKQAHMWAFVKGVPMKGVAMSRKTYLTWHKLADFCASL